MRIERNCVISVLKLMNFFFFCAGLSLKTVIRAIAYRPAATDTPECSADR
jgi:hypothetical protein